MTQRREKVFDTLASSMASVWKWKNVRVPTVMENPGKKNCCHGKSWKSLGIWKFPKKSWKVAGCHGKVMELLVIIPMAAFWFVIVVHVVRHNHNHVWKHVRMGVMERSKSVMEKSWNSVSDFCGNPECAVSLICESMKVWVRQRAFLKITFTSKCVNICDIETSW